MKFLIITLIALSTFAGLAQCQNSVSVQRVRDQLLARANFLITLVTGEIKLQYFENRPLVAEGLELELRQLIEVELELRATQEINATDAQVVTLERRLDAIEERIDSQLRAIGRQFVSRREIGLILERTQQLIILVSETVQKLKTENRAVLALGLQEEEARLVQLEINLRATQNPQEIRRLEELLVEADYRVYEIINQLESSGVRRKRDLKADVLARAQELITQANNAIRALQAQGNRGNAIELIQRVEREIQLVADDLRNVTVEADVQRLEGRLINLEFELSGVLMSVGRPVGLQEFKLLLNTSAEGLRQWAANEIAALKAENRSQDITVLQRQEAAINQILAELANVTERQALEQLEIRLAEAEFRLFEELLRLSRPEAYKRQLVRVAEDLAVRVVQEIRFLVNQNRTLEAEGLRSQEQELVLLDVEIRDAVAVEELQRLETRLQNLELRVIDELVRLGLQAPRRKRDLKADVLKRAQELIAITNDAIKAFQAQNRSQAVQILQNAENQLQQLITELNAANLTQAQVGMLEGRLIQAEFQLAADLRRLGRPIDLNEWRDLLITRGDGLQQWAAYEIAQAKNRSVEVRRVEELEAQVRNITAVLKNATLRSDLELLERALNQVEENLIAELRILGTPAVPRDQIIALERRAEELALKLIIEIRKLYAEGRYLLAEGLQAEERNLIELDVDLRVALTPERILRVEQRLKEAEDRVAAELQRIAGSA
jgi:hypothetical protein